MNRDSLAVAIGAIIGATVRYAFTSLAGPFNLTSLPYGTLAANIMGCLLIGLFQTIFLSRPNLPRELQRFVSVGCLGGLTTFSTVSVELVQLAAGGALASAAAYFILSLSGGLLAALVGIQLAHLLLQSKTP
ncbi:fluoride efflux transporter CrcB [Candidatus Viridilinea mediisalina]|uniref:Fluoride-specific ion channel FluC n=1 Tax=Candidatus Viridilinea mediisalina TaxID=2024553 RepID=A0A2A6RML5_9CHLR|nr:fluoride efflux transporter CrcB [Candidatus Viridilinea mediisalina]PDW04302.1 hypothetical protein CJ255_04440 [Candidatus Viridilinea mediisalina]